MIKAIPWQEMESSNIASVYYDEAHHFLCVRFHNGGLYSYRYVPMDVYVSLTHAKSVGSYFYRAIRFLPYHRWDTEDELVAHLNTL